VLLLYNNAFFIIIRLLHTAENFIYPLTVTQTFQSKIAMLQIKFEQYSVPAILVSMYLNTDANRYPSLQLTVSVNPLT